MLIEFNTMTILLIVVISQSLFTSGLLFFSSENKISNRLLAILIFAIALWLTDNFFRIAGIYRQQPNLYFLPIFYSLGFGPMLYFYVISLTSQKFTLRKKHLLHFLPVIIQATLYITLSFTSYTTKQFYWENIHRLYTYRIEFDGTWISLVIYSILSFRLIKRYQTWVENNYSEVSNIRLNWLKVILTILLVLCMQWLIEIILRDVYDIYFSYDYSVIILGIIALILGTAGLKQANLIDINYQSADVELVKEVIKIDEKILQQIVATVKVKELYLNPTLTLIEFAQELKMHPKIVSKYINNGLNQSFNDFVNFYRVEEVKRRLLTSDLERLTIFGIATESGFNSKTTFNRIFKSYTGKSPSDFIEFSEHLQSK